MCHYRLSVLIKEKPKKIIWLLCINGIDESQFTIPVNICYHTGEIKSVINYCSSWWVCVSQHYPSPSIILLCSLDSRIDAYAGTDQSAIQKQPEDTYPPTGVGRRRQSPPAEGDEERKRVLHYFRLLLPSSRRASQTGSGTISVDSHSELSLNSQNTSHRLKWIENESEVLLHAVAQQDFRVLH